MVGVIRSGRERRPSPTAAQRRAAEPDCSIWVTASAGTGVSYTPEDVARYAEVGGTPPLDGGYTVFGEVVEGMEVVDAIAASDTPRQHGDAGPWADRPVQAVKVVVRPVVE